MRSFDPVLFSIFPLFFSAMLGPSLAIVIARHRHAPGARMLIALILTASLWSAGYALEIVSQDQGVATGFIKACLVKIGYCTSTFFVYNKPSPHLVHRTIHRAHTVKGRTLKSRG